LLISGITGLLPVVSWVLALKSLIINGIHFSDRLRIKLWLLKGLHVVLSESGFTGFENLQDVGCLGGVFLLSYCVYC
jgi:hypothetical protein